MTFQQHRSATNSERVKGKIKGGCEGATAVHSPHYSRDLLRSHLSSSLCAALRLRSVRLPHSALRRRQRQYIYVRQCLTLNETMPRFFLMARQCRALDRSRALHCPAAGQAVAMHCVRGSGFTNKGCTTRIGPLCCIPRAFRAWHLLGQTKKGTAKLLSVGGRYRCVPWSLLRSWGVASLRSLATVRAPL